VADPDLTVDPDKLYKAGLTLDPVHVKLRRALDRYLTSTANLGDEPWGTDSTGQAIRKAYVESKPQDVLDSITYLDEGVKDVEFRVVLMSTDYGAVEDVNSQ
jgi:hypothetical protein